MLLVSPKKPLPLPDRHLMWGVLGKRKSEELGTCQRDLLNRRKLEVIHSRSQNSETVVTV